MKRTDILLAFIIVMLFGASAFVSCSSDDDDSADDSAGDDDGADDDAGETPVTNLENSGCQDIFKALDEDGNFIEEFKLHWEAGTISVHHSTHCLPCAFDAQPTFVLADGRVDIMENPQEGYEPAACDGCTYELSYDLTEIPAGDYEVTLSYRVINNAPYNGPFMLFGENVSFPADGPADFDFTKAPENGCTVG
jgi:hypothetical protein